MKKTVVSTLFYALFLMFGHGQANAITTDLAYNPQNNTNTQGVQNAYGVENGTQFAKINCSSY